MAPRLSLVIPSYNSAFFLPETLESLLAQGLDDIEILVVDDGSTDDTERIIQPYLGETVRYFRIENSGGPARPRNIGIQEARAPLVGFFDSDDVAIEGEVFHSICAMENNPNVGLLCTNFHISDENLEVIRSRVNDENLTLHSALDLRLNDTDWLLPSRTAFQLLLRTNFVGTPSVIIRKEVFESVGVFDERLRNIDDRDMWLRVSREFDVIYRDVPTFLYRRREGSISKKRLNSQAAERAYVGEKLLRSSTSQNDASLIKGWIAINYLDLGYHAFHRGNDRSLARKAFINSFSAKPSWAAFRGTIKSLLPRAAYDFLVSFKER